LLAAFTQSSAAGAPASSGARTIPAASGCTNPKQHGAPPAHGLDPGQLAAAYGVSGLWQAGFRGQGRRVALIEVGESLDKTAFTLFSHCYGPFATPIEHLVVGSKPKPGGEGILDPKVVAAIAPAARIDMFESGHGSKTTDVLPALLNAALNPRNTGGKLVDTISISFGRCEATWPTAQQKAAEAVLQRASKLGVAVFVAAGDSGSVSYYSSNGAKTCIGHPVDTKAAKRLHGVSLGLGFPGSSPQVTSVGGTELAINGKVPRSGSPKGGTVTDEIVWNEAQQSSPTTVWGGGGGKSKLFTVADAPWQRLIGLSGAESKPDIAALAGSPMFLNGGIGTSGASPLMAGAIAVLDGYLVAHHAKATGPLNPLIYKVAKNASFYKKVFRDVIHGSNDLLHLGCCSAIKGYDRASGLGSLNVQALGSALLSNPGLRP
jgi:kumamolisin